MSSNQETTASKFDALYRNAAKVFAAQSLLARFDSAPKNKRPTSSSSDSAKCTYTVYSTMDFSGNLQPQNSWNGAIDTTPWVPDVNGANTSGYVYNGETYYYDWYEWWRYPYEKHIYHWPDFTQTEIKKILEEIRDSIKPATNKLSKDLVSEGWPPSDVSVNENGSLVVEVALAGYSKDTVEAAIVGDKLVVKFKDSKKTNTSPIQSGIKRGDGSIEFFVDPVKFNAEEAQVTFENGILCVCVPTTAKQIKKLDIK